MIDQVYPEIFLTRDDLDTFPKFKLPEGYFFRNYHFKDEENWFKIYKASDGYNKVYSTTFREYFGAKVEKLEKRQIYLCNEAGETVATATAWDDKDFEGEHWGRLHWVAVHPNYQSKGLSKPLLAEALQRLKDCGHKKVYLRTFTMRNKAINLYLSFGFEPLIRNDFERDVWFELSKKINHPSLSFLK